VMSTASNSSLKQFCSAFTNVTSALDVNFNAMRSINSRFTYLLVSRLRAWFSDFGLNYRKRTDSQRRREKYRDRQADRERERERDILVVCPSVYRASSVADLSSRCFSALRIITRIATHNHSQHDDSFSLF